MFYPVNLNLDNMEIIIVGGGNVALRKCMNFLDFGKSVTVLAPDFDSRFLELGNKVDLINDIFKEEYIDKFDIVVAATDDKEVNEEIACICRKKSKLINVVDSRDLSDFTVSSYVKRGDLLIGISTGGKIPALSAKIRRDLEEIYDESFAEYVDLLGELREKIIKKYEDKIERKKVLKALVELDIEELKEIEKNI
ncbi:precorrin-2 dehydrogenase/sirohydrochlorin ferrochelatase family protein [Peptoclostridium sp. AF21-18]|uniref:precorrin-2 dehydrogenase/sirohydrochlorin ferrochelatase family protein n=1 Tax=Peptoclostridium sp. AF21-18 TaxID=2292243 RepID=UPI000E5338F8|nr:bifunctional precorrin-2 dehydrogenase/sirohydrochlorin ferrochelatase [Peptoclostridium sp. AF21-18]RHQ98882.1 bifunctional precorrin-2 dehydrogenase/sirohydrochlorin ferrochelatase [Peptoclostridium sp. AF21-18]